MSHLPRLPRGRRAAPLAALLALAALIPSTIWTPRSAAADLAATPATLSSVFAGAQPGDVIHLAAGSYGTFHGGAKAGIVTLMPQPGATATIAPDLTGAANIRFQGLVVGATSLQGSRAIEFVGNRFTGMTVVDVPRSMTHAGILFDGNDFLGIDTCSSCYEGRLTIRGNDNTQPVGITITRNHFGGGGESDGLQVIGGAYGVQIVANELDHIKQGSYDTHVDPLQLYGSSHTRIAGNYFHDNETNIMAADGTDHEVIEDNLFVTPSGGYPWAIRMGADQGSTIIHNTLVDGACEFNLRCGTLSIDGGNQNVPSRGTVVRDNLVTALSIAGDSALAEEDHNLVVRGGGKGAHDLAGQPRYAGGTSTTTWDGFRLAPGSPGAGAASDGRDVGIGDRGTTAGSGSPTGSATGGRTAAPTGSTASGTPSGSNDGGRRTAGTPTVALVRPAAGAVLSSSAAVAVRAHDASGIARVELWLNGRRVARDTRAPYRVKLRLHGRGLQTITARAVARDGGSSSTTVTVLRRRRAASRRDARHAWRIGATTRGGATTVSGRGPAGARAVLMLGRCRSRSAVAVRRVAVTTGRHGVIHASAPAGLCVVRVRPLA